MFSSTRTHAPWLKFESFMSSPWPSTCVRSLHLDPPFLLVALPSAPFPLPQQLEICDKPAQLLQREYGLYWRVLPLHRLYQPKAHDFYETSVEPYVQLLDSPPLFSNKVSSSDPDYDDATLEDMLHQVHRAQAYHSLREDLSVSLSSSLCSMGKSDLLERDRVDSVSTEAQQKHRFGLCSIIKKNRSLQNAKQELINTNFKQLEPKKCNDFFKDNYCCKSWNFVNLIEEVSLKWKN